MNSDYSTLSSFVIKIVITFFNDVMGDVIGNSGKKKASVAAEAFLQ